MVNDARSASSISLTAGHITSGIYTLETAEHFWPWYSNAPLEMAVTTWPRIG